MDKRKQEKEMRSLCKKVTDLRLKSYEIRDSNKHACKLATSQLVTIQLVTL